MANDANRIKVFPGHDGAGLVHPKAGALTGGDGGTLWPADSFTHRRIAEGSLVRESMRTVLPDSPTSQVAPRVRRQTSGPNKV